MPFKKYGKLVGVLGTGLALGQGQGSFSNPRPTRDSNGDPDPVPIRLSEEVYDIVIVPLTVQLNYRLEYFDRQFIAPYVSSGFTYFGLAELQRGGKAQETKFSGSPSVFAGGGINLNLSRWSPKSAYNMYSSYKVVDLWLTLDYKRVQSLKNDIDFSGNFIQLGITMDQ